MCDWLNPPMDITPALLVIVFLFIDSYCCQCECCQQNLQTKQTIHMPITKCVPTTVKCGGQTFWWVGGAKLDKSSPICWSALAV